MLYKQRSTFYDKWSSNRSRDLDTRLYDYFSRKSDVSGIPLPCGAHAPHGLFDYTKESTISAFRSERQQFALFSKNVSYGSDAEKRKLAWDAFCESELRCKAVNERYSQHETLGSSPDYEAVLFIARRKISQVLGDVPSIASLNLGFGPGANSTVKKKTSIPYKLEAKPTCSKSLLPLLEELWATVPMYAFSHHGRAYVAHGELAFVPKDSKKHRSIIIEPILNTFIQKGVGAHLKARLKMFGIDLTDQSINRNRARLSSIDNSLATVDMSSASDNIAYAVVLDLLPKPWFDFLDNLRTSYIVFKEKKLSFSLEKFSTMGCGFTFELQSLIFYALAYACHVYQDIRPDVSVFGDDVILASSVYPFFCDILHQTGFVVNINKSYGDGPFRESCGGDYLNGINIRPFYVLDKWSDSRVVSFLNFYYEDPLLDDDMREYLISLLNKKNILFGPKAFGDGHIHSETIGTPHNRGRGFAGFTFKTFVMRSKRSTECLRIGHDLFPIYGLPYNEEELDLYEFTRPFTRSRALEYALQCKWRENEILVDSLRSPFRNEKDASVIRGGATAKVVDIYYIPD